MTSPSRSIRATARPTAELSTKVAGASSPMESAPRSESVISTRHWVCEKRVAPSAASMLRVAFEMALPIR